LKLQYTAVLGKDMAMPVNQVAAPFVEVLSEHFDAITLIGPVDHMVFCPIILPAHLNTTSDHAPTYSRTRRSLFVARNIHYEAWETGSHPVRLQLLVAAFKAGIRAAKPRHLKATDIELLTATIERAASKCE
jgi:hypothetical protein